MVLCRHKLVNESGLVSCSAYLSALSLSLHSYRTWEHSSRPELLIGPGLFKMRMYGAACPCCGWSRARHDWEVNILLTEVDSLWLAAPLVNLFTQQSRCGDPGSNISSPQICPLEKADEKLRWRFRPVFVCVPKSVLQLPELIWEANFKVLKHSKGPLRIVSCLEILRSNDKDNPKELSLSTEIVKS